MDAIGLGTVVQVHPLKILLSCFQSGTLQLVLLYSTYCFYFIIRYVSIESMNGLQCLLDFAQHIKPDAVILIDASETPGTVCAGVTSPRNCTASSNSRLPRSPVRPSPLNAVKGEPTQHSVNIVLNKGDCPEFAAGIRIRGQGYSVFVVLNQLKTNTSCGVD